MATHCYVCTGNLNNSLRCSECDSVMCSEICLVAHRKLMHPTIQRIGREAQKIGAEVGYGIFGLIMVLLGSFALLALVAAVVRFLGF